MLEAQDPHPHRHVPNPPAARRVESPARKECSAREALPSEPGRAGLLKSSSAADGGVSLCVWLFSLPVSAPSSGCTRAGGTSPPADRAPSAARSATALSARRRRHRARGAAASGSTAYACLSTLPVPMPAAQPGLGALTNAHARAHTCTRMCTHARAHTLSTRPPTRRHARTQARTYTQCTTRTHARSRAQAPKHAHTCIRANSTHAAARPHARAAMPPHLRICSQRPGHWVSECPCSPCSGHGTAP